MMSALRMRRGMGIKLARKREKEKGEEKISRTVKVKDASSFERADMGRSSAAPLHRWWLGCDRKSGDESPHSKLPN